MPPHSQIAQFIQTRILQARKQSHQAVDPMYKLKYAIAQVSFAQTLSQYLRNGQYLYAALLHLSHAYIQNQSYAQAITQARLAKKQANRIGNGKEDETVLIIAQCMAKQDRHDDAEEIMDTIDISKKDQTFNKNYYQLLLTIQVKLKKEDKVLDTLKQIQTIVKNQFGEKTQQYGFFLVEKGKSIGSFDKLQSAVTYLNQGIEALIHAKCKEKKSIMQIYLTLAEYHKKLNNLQKQYSSLICAHSMAKQLEEPQMATLPIIHLIANNLIQKQEYSKALKQLKTAKQIQKQCFGESSSQLAKTVKKITEILSKMNMKSEMKKYEQQYSRIVGHSKTVFKEKQTNI